MKTKILVNLFAIVSMLVIVGMTWMPTASAWSDEGTETIDEDYYWYQTVDFHSGNYLTLSYTITVENDQYIDVMLLDEENFNKYKNDQSFSYYRDGTDFNTIYKDVPSITFYEHDNYYIVVDNTDDPPGGAQPAWDGINNYCTFHYTTSGEAHYYPSDDGDSTTYNDEGYDFGLLCIVGLLVVVILIVLVVVALVLKKKGQVPPVAPPYQQPQQPLQSYYRDQQPPPPPDYRPPQQPY